MWRQPTEVWCLLVIQFAVLLMLLIVRSAITDAFVVVTTTTARRSYPNTPVQLQLSTSAATTTTTSGYNTTCSIVNTNRRTDANIDNTNDDDTILLSHSIIPQTSVVTTRREQLQHLAVLLSSCALASTAIIPEAANAAAAASTTTKATDVVVTNEQSLLSTTAGGVSENSHILLSEAAAAAAEPIQWDAVFQKAGKKALGGGKAGASAAVVQVVTLMWLRTCMNYQYRYGGNLQSSLQTLWDDGGIRRLYQGLPFALIQGPATRFGDTAANVGVLALLETASPVTQSWPLPVKTACGSVAAGLWRILLMPIDTSKTVMQVDGRDGLSRLWGDLVPSQGLSVLYRGAIAQAAATAAGNFPWFYTYNSLDAILPTIPDTSEYSILLLTLARAAVLGVSASCVSDCVSNSLRVIKTTKQTAQSDSDDESSLSYKDVIQLIVQTDGYVGLFGRGLQTRLLTNAIQGAVFSILWKYFQQVQQ